MGESMYPKCDKCAEGILLPFFDYQGENWYVCTHCSAIFRSDRDMQGNITSEYK